MSLEHLKEFIHAVEHSYSLRKKLKQCDNNYTKIFELAATYGFKINSKDLEEDIQSQKVRSWFDSSYINPIKRI